MSKKILLQGIFWLVIFVINLALSPVHEMRANVVFYELGCVIIYALVFYMNIFVLFPRCYDQHKFWYAFISLLLIILAAIIMHVFFEVVSHDHRRRHSGEWFVIITTFRQALWLVLVFLIGTVYSIQEKLNQQIKRHKQVMEEKLQTELQLLKAQINPHFLFNALNDIYSLTYMKSEKAPDSVLKLSDMLRYVLDDCSLEKVPLHSEITYIENLIDFYQMKSPGKRKISFAQDIEDRSILIAPMLFIPFIENGFKYSRIEEDKKGFILINLKESAGKLTFSIENSLFQARTILSGSKKGMANVKQRLDIIYPGKHTLNMGESDNVYRVYLEIYLI